MFSPPSAFRSDRKKLIRIVVEEEVVPQTMDAIAPERAVGLCLAGQVQTSTVAGKNRWKGDRRRGGCSANHDRGYSCRRDRGWMAKGYCQSEIVRTFEDGRRSRMGCTLTKVHQPLHDYTLANMCPFGRIVFAARMTMCLDVEGTATYSCGRSHQLARMIQVSNHASAHGTLDRYRAGNAPQHHCNVPENLLRADMRCAGPVKQIDRIALCRRGRGNALARESFAYLRTRYRRRKPKS